jgi:RNA polymerase sigma factor (sigma-70 family)
MNPSPSSPGAFGRLYERTLQPLRRHLARLLGDPFEAEEVAHDAFLRIFPRDPQGVRNPDALLFTTARRLALNRIRRRRSSPVVALDADPDLTPDAGELIPDAVMREQEHRLLREAVGRLPQGCRTVLVLHRVDRLSHREIADHLGISVSTVEKQHARALRLLRDELAPVLDAGPDRETAATGKHA